MTARGRMTEMITLRSPDGVSPAALTDLLRAEGHEVTRNEVSDWICDMRTAGLVAWTGYGGWRITTTEERAGAVKTGLAATGTWDYEFTAHAAEQAHPVIRLLLANIVTRQVMTFNTQEFASFRDDLAARGVELHEVTRVPHFEPEAVE